jgi:hypothetical protein
MDFHEDLRQARSELKARLAYGPPRKLPRAVIRASLGFLAFGFIGLGAAVFMAHPPDLLAALSITGSVTVGAVFLAIAVLF